MGKIVRDPHQKMTVYDHIRELQVRFLYLILALIIAGIVVFMYYQPLIVFLSAPIGSTLYYNNPAGGFNFIMKVCFTGALILTMPVLIYNIIVFIRPAIEKYLSVKKVFLISGISTVLAFSGASFAFYLILPNTLRFLKDFENSGLSALITADDYFRFVTNIIITFVIVFQLPLIITFFDSIKPMTTKKLISMEKWVILGSIVIALMMPIAYDPITGLMLALPIVVLYNLSVIIIISKHAIIKRRNKNSNIFNKLTYKQTANDLFLIDDNTIASFADELNRIKQFNQPLVTITNQRKKIDIEPIKSATNQSKNNYFIARQEKINRHMAFNQKIKVFSDIRPVNRINPALASQ
ncbi:MAG TPA: twin-arginine translocase subunit TatC [Candidatus Saccharibacteria bacterium]|nr:twin-arginine translocase subunit TatC [Candidatus Saccharibacteria bacterium]